MGPSDVVGSEVLSMRIVVLGRTRVTVPDWTEPEATFAVFDGDSQNKDRSAKWRRIDVEVNLRNYKF
jgi:hypothetical protein